ncbi:MAG TPA: M23 family metallopeptidase [Gemmatimonadaceae bacterium]|nr:M23 family metallopeptidase [Gemmatimonadaceae bacterium]
MKPSPVLLAFLALVACKITPKSAEQSDTTVATPAGSAARPATADSVVAGVSPGAGADSITPTDSGVVTLHPSLPRRGGVLFVMVQGVTTDPPRCTWKSSVVPCYRVEGGVRALIPLPADEPAGPYTLTIERPGGRITRQVTVADREFERELVFLDSARYALLAATSNIGRDARALRQVLSTESAEQRWSGAWRDPVEGGGRSSAHGVERFYFRASDSARAVTLPPAARVRGAFASDTGFAVGEQAPGWRHSGVDIAARRGAAVRASAAGLVTDASEYTLTGRTVVLDHGQGVHSAYFHLDTILVRRGEVVRQGALLGRVGETGLTTGPHLHYGVYLHGRDVDPVAWRDMPEFARRGGAGAERAAR